MIDQNSLLGRTGSGIHRSFNRPLSQYWFTRRFDPIFHDGPSLHWLRMNAEAYRAFRAVDPKDFVHVGMFSFSRAGSHLFESQFHYMRPCFCFGEAYLDIATDLNWRTFLCRGMYRTDSIQSKRVEELTHLFYNCNKSPAYLDRAQWSPSEPVGFRRKWVLVLRNPLRVLLSREATKKKKWLFSEEGVEEFFSWFDKARERFLRLLEQNSDDVHVVSVEQFVAHPTPVLDEVAEKVGLTRDQVRSRASPREFFAKIGRTGEHPVEREGYLASPTRNITISGWGGKFNPLLDIDIDRIYKHELDRAIPAEILRLARSRLGERAFDFYMRDREHRFENVKAVDLLRL